MTDLDLMTFEEFLQLVDWNENTVKQYRSDGKKLPPILTFKDNQYMRKSDVKAWLDDKFDAKAEDNEWNREFKKQLKRFKANPESFSPFVRAQLEPLLIRKEGKHVVSDEERRAELD